MLSGSPPRPETSGWQHLGPSSATLLLTLAARAHASGHRPELGLHDPLAQRVAEGCPLDLRPYTQDPGFVQGVVLRSLIFDRLAQAQIRPWGGAMSTVTLGAGLCTRWSRLGHASGGDPRCWFNLDLPEVIGLRRECLSEQEGGACLVGSVDDSAWFDAPRWTPDAPLLLLMEGVSPYLSETAVLGLLSRLAEHSLKRGLSARLLLDYVHPALAQGSAHEVGGLRLPVQGGFENGAAFTRAHPAIALRGEQHPFAAFSPGHALFDAAFQARHRAAPYGIACLDIGCHGPAQDVV